MSAPPVLSLNSVSRRFDSGVVALDCVDLQIGAGEFVVLLGPSGCGKSTLLRLIAGLDAPNSGTITWHDKPAPGEIGFVFQDPTLMPWADAQANVAMPLRLRGVADAQARARAALSLVGLDDFATARPATLSGGMRMRVSIARALAARPRVLLMDEPFAALDEFTRHRLQDDVLRITAELGCTTVFVTHSLYEGAYLADRIVLMRARPGQIAAEIPAPGPRPRDRFGDTYLPLLARLQAEVAANAVAT